MSEGSGFEDLWLGRIDGGVGGRVLEVFIFLYSFLGLAIVCDQYLIVSLETLCYRWHIPEDVAGASFMAVGSAAPEIIINAITTLKGEDHSDLGVSAIIGSGMIAFLLIPGMCALASPRPLKLKRRPLLRDITAYGASLTMLCLFFRDGVIKLAEAATLIGSYAVYLLVVFFAPLIRKKYREFVDGTPVSVINGSFVEQNNRPINPDEVLIEEESVKGLGMVRMGRYRIVATEEEDDAGIELDEGGEFNPHRRHRYEFKVEYDTLQNNSRSSWGQTLFEIISWPLHLVFGLTLPECAYDTPRAKWYPITFMFSFAWVAVFSFVISAVVGRWVVLSQLSMVFFGLICVAVGAEIPDSIQSVAVARKGYGSMAAGNAMGSQITNILVGLGLPWFISNLAGRPVSIPSHDQILTLAYFQAGNLACSFSVLLGVACIRKQGKAMLTRPKGLFFIFVYVLVICLYGVMVF